MDFTPKFMLLIVLIWASLLGCSNSNGEPVPIPATDPETVEDNDYHEFVLSTLSSPPDGSYVMIMAHRGDHLEVPENSLQSIENCIDLGLDMAEIDIQRTRDGVLILMHDQTLDRTTEGSGLISSMNWAEIRNLRLKNADGSLSPYTIPSLELALELAKDRMVLFLDKAYDYHNEIHELLTEKDMLDQVLVEGIAALNEYQADYPDIWHGMNFAARIGAGQSTAYIQSHVNNPEGRFLFPSCNLILTQEDKYELVKHSDDWLLFAPLNFTNCSEDFEQNWSWAIDQGIDIIITDKPRELLAYLRKEGKHQ